MSQLNSVPLCYLPQALHLKKSGRLQYIFDANGASLPLYFALKGKHGYSLDNQDVFRDAVRGVVEQVAQAYDLVVYPQSRFPFLQELVAGLPNTQRLVKRSKEAVIQSALEHAHWNKLERQSQQRCWAEMGETFTINLVKSNQRKHYVPHLFERVELGERRVLLLDDFIMSGNTLSAMLAAIGRSECDSLGVFYQTAYGGAR